MPWGRWQEERGEENLTKEDKTTSQWRPHPTGGFWTHSLYRFPIIIDLLRSFCYLVLSLSLLFGSLSLYVSSLLSLLSFALSHILSVAHACPSSGGRFPPRPKALLEGPRAVAGRCALWYAFLLPCILLHPRPHVMARREWKARSARHIVSNTSAGGR